MVNWIYQNCGRWLATIWYWAQILHLFPSFLRNFFY